MKKIALASLLIVSSLFAQNIELAYFKSYNYEKMGDYKDAIKSLIPIYKEQPKGYALNLRLGHLFFLDKKYSNSQEHYKKATLIEPHSIDAKLGLVKSYLKMNKIDNALAITSSIVKMDYYNYYGNFYQIVALKLKNQNKEAIKVANKMLALYPTNILFLQELAKLQYQIDKKKGIKIFKEILVLDPNNVVAKEYIEKEKKYYTKG